MILAGIDEAGYGPLLGPLVSAGAAFRIDGVPAEEPLPDLWTQLGRVVSAKRPTDGRKLHVNDSKKVYSPAGGLAALERGALCLSGSTRPGSFLDLTSPGLTDTLATYSWYAPPIDAASPIAASATDVGIMGNAYRAEAARVGVATIYARTHVLCEREYNRQVQATRNKASVMAGLVLRHISALIDAHANEGLTVVCDRLGGRTRYGPLLRQAFEDWALTIESEADERADYTLARGGGTVRLVFAEKAESLALPVAAASMLAKYTRELLMYRFNNFWATHAPGVAPTAGYYTDALRWLEATSTVRAGMGVPDERLVRIK